MHSILVIVQSPLGIDFPNRDYNVNIIREGILLRAEKKWAKVLADYERDGIGVWSAEQFMASVLGRSASPTRK